MQTSLSRRTPCHQSYEAASTMARCRSIHVEDVGAGDDPFVSVQDDAYAELELRSPPSRGQ
jgi:hypothetical protein